jgi:hypothetical protein
MKETLKKIKSRVAMAMDSRSDKFRLVNMRNVAFLTLALTAASLVSCGDNGKEGPEIRQSQEHQFNISNSSALDSKISEIGAKADDKKNTIIVDFSGDLGLKSKSFSALQEILGLSEHSNVMVNWNAKKIYSDEANQVLDADKIKTLAAACAKGMVLAINPDTGEMFWLNSADASFCTDAMLKVMGYSDAHKIVLENTSDITAQMTNALDRANRNEKLSLEIGTLDIEASKGPLFKEAMDHKNISVQSNYNISVIADQNPVPASHINAFYDYSGGTVKLVIPKDEKLGIKTVSGLVHIMANDSTFNMLVTRSTAQKKTGHMKTVSETDGNIIDPAVGMYDIGANWEYLGIPKPQETGKSVDGHPMQKLDVKELHIGIYNNENGGHYIMDASVRMINEKKGEDGIYFYYPAMEDGVALVPSKAPEYNHLYNEVIKNKIVTAPTIPFSQVHFEPISSRHTEFQRVFFGSKGPTFKSDAMSFLFTTEDIIERWNYGILGESLEILTRELRPGLARAGYVVPDEQGLVYSWPETYKNELLPLSFYEKTGHEK